MKNEILALASKLILASTTGDEAELKNVSELLAAELNKEKTGENSPALEKDCYTGFLKFTDKEISKMPKTFKKEFRAQGCTAHVLKRKSGRRSWNYVIRYRRNGYNVAVSSNNLETAKAKFIEILNACPDTSSAADDYSAPTTFNEFATYYFENFWKRTVKETTYTNEMYRYRNHVKPFFESAPLAKITPKQCQQLLDDLEDKQLYKTNDEIYSILSKVFKAAVKHGIIRNNPLDLVVHKQHARKHGKALTVDEEQKLLAAYAGTRYQLLFAVALYTGLRPNEYKTARLNGNFIIAVNSKRKNGNVEYKKIPVTPMLLPYLDGVTGFDFPRIEYMRDNLNKVLSGHILYDLRTTFYTRAKECGVAEVAVKSFVGHSLGGLADTYTDLSDEFLLREGNKIKY